MLALSVAGLPLPEEQVNGPPATEAQIQFIVDRWGAMEGLFTQAQECLKDQAALMAGLTKARATELMTGFARVRRQSELAFYGERGARTCANCKIRPTQPPGRMDPCEQPSMFGQGKECPSWVADIQRLHGSYEGFLKQVRGRRCVFRSPSQKEAVLGTPFDYMPGEAMWAKVEPSGEVRMFLFGEGVQVEVAE